MNVKLPRPTHTTNITLFAEDVAYYRKTLGTGWTARVRDLVEADVKARKERALAKQRAANLTNVVPAGALGPQPAGPADVLGPPDDDQE